ncbi:MAG TPA: metal ABC transporter substrate-binding protein [Candidatus Sulfotelmatobacter sp.]|nr:metal ABC transporter substrate-binding protein [Candidatus Sulfotelmatobacter sp.]
MRAPGGPVLALGLLAVLAGVLGRGLPAGEGATVPGQLPVVASNSVLADLASEVGGPQVVVRALAPAGTDPHTFQPTPESMQALARARVVFYNGAGLEEWWDKTIRTAARRDVPVVELSKGLATLRLPGDAGAEPDPHAWLDPVLAQAYVERIRDALAQADPPRAGEYHERAQAYLAKLTALDRWIRGQVDQVPPDRRKMVTFHDAFQYFARRYGFTIEGFLVPSPGKEPSAKALAGLARRIREARVPAVFAEADFNPKMLEVLGRDAGVKVVTNLYDGSLSNGPPADSYLALMRHNVTTIVDALK